MTAPDTSLKPDFRFRARTNDVPIARLIGFEAKEIGDGRAVVTLAAGGQHANPMARFTVKFFATSRMPRWEWRSPALLLPRNPLQRWC